MVSISINSILLKKQSEGRSGEGRPSLFYNKTKHPLPIAYSLYFHAYSLLTDAYAMLTSTYKRVDS